MRVKARTHEAFVEKVLIDLIFRVRMIEADIAVIAERRSTDEVTQRILHLKLEKLTLKRHAVLTATLGELNFREIASLMDSNPAAIRAHLKAALSLLGIPDRRTLLTEHADMLDFTQDKEYERRYGISKVWWVTGSQELLTKLRQTTPGKK